MNGTAKKVGQAAVIWAIVLFGLAWVWPPSLRLPQIWMLVGVGLCANALQPAYSPFEAPRTQDDRWTATQIVWTVYGVQIAALAELVWKKPEALTLGAFSWSTFGLMVAGIGLRTWSVVVLGPWFTWNVQVQSGQRVVESGPYRFVRHPSYTGALVAFVSAPLLLESFVSASLAAIALPLAFRRRIAHEERVLRASLPEYAAYATRTGALFPKLFSRDG